MARKKAAKKDITVQEMIEKYGKDKTAAIITKETNRTIIKVKIANRQDDRKLRVVLVDPIPGRLVVNNTNEISLAKISKSGEVISYFTRAEVESMAKKMPGFRKYYKVEEL